MQKQFTVAILGCGNRGACYSKYMLTSPDKYRIVALCDPNPAQLQKMHDLFGLSDAIEFLNVEAFFAQKHADVLVIASPDRVHVEQAVRGMELGYDLLLEKPVSDDRDELSLLLATQQRTNRKVTICHELRYGKGYLKCKEILDSGRLGTLYAIDASERVAYWHWTQAYVKGVGASIRDGHPAILAKCSHDLDLLQSYAKSRCESISSFGTLSYFKRENAPHGAAERCLDCKHVETCPYSAKRVYIDGWHKAGEPTHQWPYTKVSIQVPLTEQALLDGIRHGPQGRCVFLCPTDLVDHQVVHMCFQNGVVASLKMVYAAEMGRRYVFYCTQGELVLDERSNTIEVMPFGEAREVIDIAMLLQSGQKGHGGGDRELIRMLYDTLTGKTAGTTTLQESIECHLMGICAEESRYAGGKLLPVHR